MMHDNSTKTKKNDNNIRNQSPISSTKKYHGSTLGYGSTIWLNIVTQYGKPWLTTVDHMVEPYQKHGLTMVFWVWLNHKVDHG